MSTSHPKTWYKRIFSYAGCVAIVTGLAHGITSFGLAYAFIQATGIALVSPFGLFLIFGAFVNFLMNTVFYERDTSRIASWLFSAKRGRCFWRNLNDDSKQIKVSKRRDFWRGAASCVGLAELEYQLRFKHLRRHLMTCVNDSSYHGANDSSTQESDDRLSQDESNNAYFSKQHALGSLIHTAFKADLENNLMGEAFDPEKPAHKLWLDQYLLCLQKGRDHAQARFAFWLEALDNNDLKAVIKRPSASVWIRQAITALFFVLALAMSFGLSLIILAGLEDAFLLFQMGSTLLVAGGAFTPLALVLVVPTAIVAFVAIASQLYVTFNEFWVDAYQPGGLSGLRDQATQWLFGVSYDRNRDWGDFVYEARWSLFLGRLFTLSLLGGVSALAVIVTTGYVQSFNVFLVRLFNPEGTLPLLMLRSAAAVKALHIFLMVALVARLKMVLIMMARGSLQLLGTLVFAGYTFGVALRLMVFYSLVLGFTLLASPINFLTLLLNEPLFLAYSSVYAYFSKLYQKLFQWLCASEKAHTDQELITVASDKDKLALLWRYRRYYWSYFGMAFLVAVNAWMNNYWIKETELINLHTMRIAGLTQSSTLMARNGLPNWLEAPIVPLLKAHTKQLQTVLLNHEFDELVAQANTYLKRFDGGKRPYKGEKFWSYGINHNRQDLANRAALMVALLMHQDAFHHTADLDALFNRLAYGRFANQRHFKKLLDKPFQDQKRKGDATWTEADYLALVNRTYDALREHLMEHPGWFRTKQFFRRFRLLFTFRKFINAAGVGGAVWWLWPFFSKGLVSVMPSMVGLSLWLPWVLCAASLLLCVVAAGLILKDARNNRLQKAGGKPAGPARWRRYAMGLFKVLGMGGTLWALIAMTVVVSELVTWMPAVAMLPAWIIGVTAAVMSLALFSQFRSRQAWGVRAVCHWLAERLDVVVNALLRTVGASAAFWYLWSITKLIPAVAAVAWLNWFALGIAAGILVYTTVLYFRKNPNPPPQVYSSTHRADGSERPVRAQARSSNAHADDAMLQHEHDLSAAHKDAGEHLSDGKTNSVTKQCDGFQMQPLGANAHVDDAPLQPEHDLSAAHKDAGEHLPDGMANNAQPENTTTTLQALVYRFILDPDSPDSYMHTSAGAYGRNGQRHEALAAIEGACKKSEDSLWQALTVQRTLVERSHRSGMGFRFFGARSELATRIEDVQMMGHQRASL